jgi:hypothetical protein
MASLDDFFELRSMPVVGVASAVVAFVLFPGLRPQFAGLLKAGTKLYLEAELGADDALAEYLAQATVRGLLDLGQHLEPEDRGRKVERRLKRFATHARHGAGRRAFDSRDAEHRYNKRITALERAIADARHRARPWQHSALDHAAASLDSYRPLRAEGTAGHSGTP